MTPVDPNTNHPDESRAVLDAATDAFWESVVRHHPDAKTGDLSPLTTLRFEVAAEQAIREWVNANVRR